MGRTSADSTEATAEPSPADARSGAPRRIAFLGLGLIGGSIAMALRDAARSSGGEASALELVAWSPSGRGPAAARARGIVDRAAPSPASAVNGADLVLLAGPPLAILDDLAALAGPWRAALRRDAVVTDVASTKAVIVARADELGIRFVGGHPMAGREASGLEAGSAALFDGRPWVIVPGRSASPADTLAVEQLAVRVGARPVRMTAAAHDEAVAAISHLPLLISAALVEAVTGADDWLAARGLAASGWRDTTRLARGDPDMGAGILATNSAAVAGRLVAVRAALDRWLAILEPGGPGAEAAGDRAAALRDRLAAARAALEAGPEPKA